MGNAVLRAGQWVSYVLFRAAAAGVRLLPTAWAFGLGKLFGHLGNLVMPGYRRLVRRNLEIAFGGERAGAELDRMAWRVLPRLGANLLAGVNLSSRPPEVALGRLEVVGRERLDAAAEGGRGLVLALCHMGCWELLALVGKIGWAGQTERPASLYQPLGNPFIDGYLKRMRERSGVELIDRRGGFGRPAALLGGGGGLGVLVDQHAGDKGVWCPFFGRLASTSNLTALLALRTGAPVLPVAMVTTGRARWRLEIGEPLVPDGSWGGDAGRFTAALNLRVEEAVRRSPEDWFWVHRRWKTPQPNFLLDRYRRGISTARPLTETDLKPFKTLVRSPNWLGDACMAVPAVRAIKRGRPDGVVAVLSPAKLADVWREVDEVDEVIEIPAGASVRGAAKAVKASGHRFDAGVLLPNSLRVAIEMWLAGVPERFGVAGSWRKRLLTKVVKERQNPGPATHHTGHFLRIARELGAELEAATGMEKEKEKDRERRPENATAGDATDGGPDLLAPLPGWSPVQNGTLKLGVCPGAEYGAAKRWPAERFGQVAAAVCWERENARWTVYGVAADREAAAAVEAALPEGRCENLAGETSLAELIEGLRSCHLLLTNDTGTMHLAALLGVPVVAVFGSTDPAWTGPLGDGHTVVRRHAECSPCFLRDCPLDFRCMLDVTPEMVTEAVLGRVNSDQ